MTSASRYAKRTGRSHRHIPEGPVTTRYTRWRDVPPHLMTAARLAELEFPRTPGEPVATIDAPDWRGKRATFPLYDALTSPPTRTTAARLEQLHATKGLKLRTCQDCGAHCQHLLDPRMQLCPACRHITLIRQIQNNYVLRRQFIARDIANWLATDRAAVAQIDAIIPPRTDSGRERPPTAIRVRAVAAATGKNIIDVLIRTVGPRAQFIPEGAVSREIAVPQVHAALHGRLLLFWDSAEASLLCNAAPHDDWNLLKQPWWKFVRLLSTTWRSEINPYEQVTSTTHSLVRNVPPGTPDRLLLHLRRIARTAKEQP